MKILEKEKKYAVIEMVKGEKLEWVYFAATGLDIGLRRPDGVLITEHCLPTLKERVKLKIEILD